MADEPKGPPEDVHADKPLTGAFPWKIRAWGNATLREPDFSSVELNGVSVTSYVVLADTPNAAVCRYAF